MPKASSSRFNETLTSYTTRTQNKHLASLPAYNSPLCQALYEFMRLLLGIKKSSDPWPPSPTPTQLAQFHSRWCPDDPEKRLINAISQQVATGSEPTSSDLGKKKTLHSTLQTTFVKHLKEISFPHAGFNWNEPGFSPWNEAFSDLILRHWDHARVTGAFIAYSMAPRPAADPAIIKSLIHRWFNGRQDELRREQRKPGSAENKKKMIKRSHLRKRLAKNRTDTLRRLNVDKKFQEIFADPQCTSDTEELEDGTQVKVRLAWRSKIADALAVKIDQITIRRKEKDHRKAFGPAQLLEIRRQQSTAINSACSQAKIPRCLARDWYDGQLLEDLGKAARQQLDDKAPLGLSDLWFDLDQFMPSP
ncbi:hypothetical protein PGTUg99_034068 [Puccinia graminis f. sp. tritici]|uniref:Uncharacterized protein n=1 Tax=Puccinia graminis f. sp. tritici TaxID=56615 RepID=A0A5B0SEF7_PUCGR|nr:hypothetical protein PGTUg99_034068 [Puccinia graminis f. sp. tritici]